MSVSAPFALDTHWKRERRPDRPSAASMPSVDAVSVSPACASPVIVGAPVAAAFTDGLATVAVALFESARPPVVQMAPAASQSVVSLSVTVVASPEAGRMRTVPRRVLAGRRALRVHHAPVADLDRPVRERRQRQPVGLLAEDDLEDERPDAVVLGRHAVESAAPSPSSARRSRSRATAPGPSPTARTCTR